MSNLEQETNENGCYRTERAFGSFVRVVPLPRDIDSESFDARFEKGVLTVRVAKKADPEPAQRQIEIAG
ncbi:MAG: Hsp20/alpha crystallin family protein [Myxococcales bacterium]|nr:Hsp20/alpha crystallin family protein [Myxococcales bacterium]